MNIATLAGHLAFGLIAFTVSDILGYPRMGALCVLPGGFLLLVGIARMWNDFLFTYGSQIINSITINDGIKWDDGTPFTAKDVDFSVKTMLCPLTNNTQIRSNYSTVM